MDCPHGNSSSTRELNNPTALDYRQDQCRSCHKQFNERTGTPFNFIEYRTEIVMLALHYYFRFKVNLDDVVLLMAMQGFSLSHQTVYHWVHYSAIKNVFGNYTTHRDNKCMNNRLEQDHRGVKSRTGPMKGFKDIFCALET